MSVPWHLLVFSLLLLSTVLAAWLGIAGSVLDEVTSRGIYAVLKDFQTLIGAGIAILAAGIAYANTTRAIRSSEKIETARRTAKKHSLRATLPLALAEMNAYATANLSALRDLYSALDPAHVLLHSSIKPPPVTPVPTGVIKAVSEFIEYATVDEGNFLKKVIQRIQIHNDRFSSMVEKIKSDPYGITTGHWIEVNILNAATISASADSAFAYARFTSEILGKEIVWDDVWKVLRLNLFDPEEHSALEKHIALRESSGTFPE